MRLILTRPESETNELAKQLVGLGHEIIKSPLFSIVPIDQPGPVPANCQAAYVTSRQAARLMQPLDLPVFAVGTATSQDLINKGWQNVRPGNGGADDLVELICDHCKPKEGPLLHICGRIRRLEPAKTLRTHGFTVYPYEIYDATDISALPESVVAALHDGEGGGILFASPRTVRVFMSLIKEAKLEKYCADWSCYCMSTMIADEAQALKWKNVAISNSKDQNSLIDLIPPSV